MVWDESKHPRDELGRWTSGGTTYRQNTPYGVIAKLLLDGGDATEKIIPITDKAIERIPLVKIPGCSDNENSYIQNQHKELLRLARTENAGFEVAFIFREGFKNKSVTYGSATSIDMTYSLHGKGRNIIVMHNHPSNKSFSLNDMAFFLSNDEVHILTIVKHNGSVEALVKTPTFERRKALKILERNYNKIVKTKTNNEIDKTILQTITNNGGLFECIKSQF